MIATERLYRTEDGRVVPEGDPSARFLLCIPGEEVPEDVEEADITFDTIDATEDTDAEDDTDDADVKEAEKADNKAVESTPNKAKRPAKKAPAKKH